MQEASNYDVIVIGGGHAGAEAAWAAANRLCAQHRETQGKAGNVALVTMDPATMGAMSCNPAIGGLAKGQIVREIDAMGGLMGLAADATGIQFRVLNASRGPAVRGPRCQSDKYRYAKEVQRLLRTRQNLHILAGRVERFCLDNGQCVGVKITRNDGPARFSGAASDANQTTLLANAVVLTTGTFMRGLMHTGQHQTEGGRVGEKPAKGISGALTDMGFELGRLKTGTPPRLEGASLDFDQFTLQPGDEVPLAFSEMSGKGPRGQGAKGPREGERQRGKEAKGQSVGGYLTDASPHSSDSPHSAPRPLGPSAPFPTLPQRPCWITQTNPAIHERIRNNLHRAPMYNGQITQGSVGPRYCPSIEDKVVRFADRDSHHVFLEPESLETDEIYCNGISTSLPADVQDRIVHHLPGCEHAKVLRYGYAVEYDMVKPHQIDSTCMTKRLPGLFLAGQINGTTGYEEAAGQGLVAGINAVAHARGEPAVRLGRDQAYIGVLLDDLVTKTPTEPYRMFTSRAEFRLMLRPDNADARLTPLARDLDLIDDARWSVYSHKVQTLEALDQWAAKNQLDRWASRPQTDVDAVMMRFASGYEVDPRIVSRWLADRQYAGYIKRQHRQVARMREQEHTALPTDFDYARVEGLRSEAAEALNRFQPTTMGQAGRLEGVNPADLMLLSVWFAGRARAGDESKSPWLTQSAA